MDKNNWAIAQQAEALRLSGAYEQAIEKFAELQKSDSDNAWLNAHLGTTYYQFMDYGNAEKYLEKAVKKNDNYLWAHAQLGETYRLWAIVENRKEEYVKSAIEHFTKALDAPKPENSNYAWALAHLGAAYRLKITQDMTDLGINEIDEPSKKQALNCLDRALELIPTYTWAWGMRSTVYRLAQDYEDAFWDLEVETVIAPEIDVLQSSYSPVPFLESRRFSLYEHTFLYFYLTKTTNEPGLKERLYYRAIAYLQKALILRPGDLMARLILITIEAKQALEFETKILDRHGELLSKIKEKLKKFFKNAKLQFSELCQEVLLYQMLCLGDTLSNDQEKRLKKLKKKAKEGNNLLVEQVLEYVLEKFKEAKSLPESEEAKLWLWKNFASTELCSSLLCLLADLSFIFQGEIVGSARPYRVLAFLINPYHTLEKLYQTPVLSETERTETFKNLENDRRISHE